MFYSTVCLVLGILAGGMNKKDYTVKAIKGMISI